MKYFYKIIHWKRLDLWRSNSSILDYGNAPLQISILAHKFLTKNSTNTIIQTPNSLDMALCDFFQFPKFKLPFHRSVLNHLKPLKKFIERVQSDTIIAQQK